MATYAPSQLRAPLALTTSAQDIVKPASAHHSVIRTLIVQANASSRTFNAGMNTSTADSAALRIFDTYSLTINIPSIFNLWLVADPTNWLTALASAAGSTVIMSASGYDYTD
jgi:hypothetical protein